MELFEEILTPPDGHSSFMLGSGRKARKRRLVEIEEVTGDYVGRATYSEVDADDPVVVRVVFGFDSVDGGAPIQMGADVPSPEWTRALAGEHAFSRAMVVARRDGSSTALADSVARMLDGRLGDSIAITIGRPTRTSGRDEYPVTARGERASFATCHGLYETMSLRGTLRVRAEDGAFLAMSLGGADAFVEDMCGPDGRGRLRGPSKTGTLHLEIRRPCFEPAQR